MRSGQNHNLSPILQSNVDVLSFSVCSGNFFPVEIKLLPSYIYTLCKNMRPIASVCLEKRTNSVFICILSSEIELNSYDK